MTAPDPHTPDAFRDTLAAALAPAYVLGRELHGGGMSRVFLVEEAALGRTVVVKVLPPDLAAGVNRERFTREIQLAARLQHPHIVPLLSAGEAAGSLYYTMPYIEGESLRAELARGRRFNVREVVRVLHDVVEALAYAHERGVIHRDVKPGNVLMLGAHGLVTDFGVAKALSAARQQSLPAGSVVTYAGTTTAGLAIGTPAYMAPEQLAADPAADHRVDIYAAGLLAYELFTGESPFIADSPQATLAAQLTRVPTPLHVVRPDVPAALSRVVERCLAKAPEQRYQTANELLADLEAIGHLATPGAGTPAPHGAVYGDVPTPPGTVPVTLPTGDPTTVSFAVVPTGGAPGTTTAAPPPAPPAKRRSPALFGGAVLGMGLVLLGGWAVVREREQRQAPAAPVALPVAPPAPVVAVPPPPATPAAPTRLTRDDSLAIAAAIERRLASEERARRQQATPRLTPGEVETLKAAAWQRAADSIRDAVAQQIGHSVRIGGARPLDTRAINEIAAGAAGIAGAALGATADAFGAGRNGPRVFTDVRPDMRSEVKIDPQTQALVVRFGERLSAPKPGVRRVAIVDLADQTPRAEHRDDVAAITESLRKAIAARGGYEIVDPALVREATRAGLPPNAIAAVTHSGAVVFGSLYMQRDSQLTVLAQVHDAQRAFPRVVRIHPKKGDDGSAQALGDAVGEDVVDALDRVQWTPRVAPGGAPAMAPTPPTQPPPTAPSSKKP